MTERPKRFTLTEQQLAEIVHGYVAVHCNALHAHYLRKLQGAPALHVQQDTDWAAHLPPDHPPEPWATTPPRQAHPGNGRTRQTHSEDGPTDDPAW